MECESTITFNIKCEDKSSVIMKAFQAFEDINPSSCEDVDQRKEKFTNCLKEINLSLNADDIFNYLKELDTGVTDIALDGTKISIDIFPREFPEELCEHIFPILNEYGFTEISCDSYSEYGNQKLKYKDNKIIKEEALFDM